MTINWLGGDYMLYGFEIRITGHGEAVEDRNLAEFTYQDLIENETSERRYELDLTEYLLAAMRKP